MRARYYEPSSGRFTNEDAKYFGLDWFSYCANDPINRLDKSGAKFEDFSQAFGALMLAFIAGAISDIFFGGAAAVIASVVVALVDGYVGIEDFLGARYFGNLKGVSRFGDLIKLIMTDEQALDGPVGKAIEGSDAEPAVIAQASEDGTLIEGLMEIEIE